jgi:hypothetical protein
MHTSSGGGSTIGTIVVLYKPVKSGRLADDGVLTKVVRPLEILAAVTLPGDLINEDAVGCAADCAWVIDGATGVGDNLLGGPSDAAWFARTVSETLKAVLPRAGALSTKAVLHEVVTRTRDALRREAHREASARHEHPSAAIALVRSRPEGLELTTLGDCQIAFRDSAGGAMLFGESDIVRFERLTLDLAAALLRADPDLTPAALRAAVLPQLRENRRAMNTAGGYWVLGVEEEALEHLQQSLIPHPTGPVVLASDGFLRLVDLFQTLTVDEMLMLRSEADVRSKLEALRRLERDDPTCRAYPRLKPSDDASVVSVFVSGAAL